MYTILCALHWMYSVLECLICCSCRSHTASNVTKIHHKVPTITVPSIMIEFHVVLSKEEWFWDNSAKAFICFSDERLGGFSCGHGPMDVK